MGLWDAITQWQASRYEKHVSKMEAEGKCPDCYGKGFNISVVSEYAYYTDSNECPGCNGSGSFADWNSAKYS
jgi:DnaJ-class molecular chaperone